MLPPPPSSTQTYTPFPYTTFFLSELRRLVAAVPGPALAARAEHPLLGPRRLLVAADAGDHPLQGVLGDGLAQPRGLARRRARRRRQRGVDLLQRRAGLALEVEPPLRRVAVAERVHLGKLLAGVHVHHRERQDRKSTRLTSSH